MLKKIIRELREWWYRDHQKEMIDHHMNMIMDQGARSTMPPYDPKHSGYNAPAYLIMREDDPVLKDLRNDEIADMAIGRMPCRTINGWYRCISIGDDQLLEKLRSRFFVKHGAVYHRKEA